MGGKKEKYSTARSGGGVLDKSIIDRMMLRFRPIAPKPAANGEETSERNNNKNNNNILTSKKPKRKYVRVRKNYKPRKKKITPSPAGDEELSQQQHKSFVTLQLLPERSSSDGGGDLPECGSNVIESRVTVECVTDTCVVVDGQEGFFGLRNYLEGDTCPGFVSDGFDSVRWVNEAYKKWVTWRDSSGGGDHGGEWWRNKEFRVSLVVKEKEKERLSYLKYGLLLPPAFGCRVRVEYTWRDRKCSRTVPCDVWRMDCGGFAWRLDVKAALSLGI